jgi:transposase
MKGTSINFLRKTCKTELNAKAKIRLKAAILRKQDMTYSQICLSLDLVLSTLSYWLNRMNVEGVTASHHRIHPGAKPFLSVTQLTSLKKELITGPEKFGFNQYVWSTRMIIAHVQKRYHIQYTARGMTDLLHRIGFSSKKPRPTHHKSASKEEQNRFKKTQKGQSENMIHLDTPRYVWMSQQIG